MQTVEAEEILLITATLNPPFMEGQRVLAAINNGTVTGKITGTVLPIGGEFGVFLSPNTYQVNVRAAIKSDDGAIIYITYGGYMTAADPAILQKLFSPAGKDLDPSSYYWRTNPLFETNAQQYAWLNTIVSVGYGSYNADGLVEYRIFAIK